MLNKALLLSQSSSSNAKPQDMPLFSRFKGTFADLQDNLTIWGSSKYPLGGKFELISGDNLVSTRGDKDDTRMIVVGPSAGFMAYCSNRGDSLKVCGVVNETTGYEAFGVYLYCGFANITVDSVACVFKKRKEAENWIAKFANGDERPDFEGYITAEPMLTLDDAGKEFVISIYMDD